MTRLPLLALSLLAAPALAEDRALVIGIDDYTALASPQVLTQAAGDATRFAAFLADRAGFASSQVTLLTDGTATSDAILTAMVDEILGQTAPGDRAVIYFAGLGTTAAVGDATLPALVASDAASPLGTITADTLAALLDEIPDRRVTLVLDTGFSGLAPDGAPARSLASASGPVADLSAFGAGGDRDLWAAAGPAEFAWESADGGVFTSFLIEGMDGIADTDRDRIVTNGELLAHLAARSQGWCASYGPCADATLTPQHTGVAEAPAFLPSHLLPQVMEPTTPDTAPLTHEQMLAFVSDLFGPTNPAGLSVGIDGPSPMPIGADIRFEATSTLSGAMILLVVDTQGRLRQIFPSVLAPDEGREVTGGTPLVIPSGQSANGAPLTVTVSGPAGRGILLALFTENAADDLAAVLPAGLTEGALDDAGRHLYTISQQLLRRDADPATRLNWSAAFLAYEVVP